MSQTPLLANGAIPSVPITLSAGGDLSGIIPIPTVTGLQGRPICVTAPTIGDVLTWNGTQWCPSGVTPVGSFLTTTYGEQGGLITVAASGAAYTIDVSLANTWDITLTANCTLTISNPAVAGVDSHIVIVLRQGGTGSYTVTWPGSVVWQDQSDGTTGGSAPTLWTAVGAQDVIELSSEDGGSTWGGSANPHGSIPTAASTVTDETTLGISPAVGTSTAYARSDHTHGSPSTATIAANVGAHAHVVSETHLSDGSTGLYTLDQSFEDGSVIAWNVTTLARLSVTETAPDQATVSPVGSAADAIVFDYAAVLA